MFAALHTTAWAALVQPGQTISTVAENDPVGGTVVGTITEPFSTAFYSGTLICNVIAGDTSNPFGGLTFTYRLTDDAISRDPLQRLRVLGFRPWTVDMSNQLSAPALGWVAPTSMDFDSSGENVGYSFGTVGNGTLLPGGSSTLLVVQTNARSYWIEPSVISGGATVVVTTFSPQPPVLDPEPAQAATVVATVAAIVPLLRRRR